MWACPPFSFIYDEVHGKTKHFLSFKVLIFTGITHWTVCFHFLSVEMYISNERRNVLWTSYQYSCRNMYVLIKSIFYMYVWKISLNILKATKSSKCKIYLVDQISISWLWCICRFVSPLPTNFIYLPTTVNIPNNYIIIAILNYCATIDWQINNINDILLTMVDK